MRRVFKQNPYYTDSITLAYLSQRSDLAKSILLDLIKSKQHTGLVQVERTVYKKGTVFTQKFWTRPDKVQSTDVILQGRQNLNAYVHREYADKEQKMNKTPKEFINAQDVWEYFGIGTADGTMFVDWEDDLDEDEKEAISQYTTYNYRAINGYLRGKEGMSQWDVYKAQEVVPVLEQAINRFELKDDIVVHRKMSADCIKMFKVGEVWQDDAFVSTTPIKGSYEPHADDNEEPEDFGVIDMVIHVKAGKGVGAWVAPISELSEENEFLLNRGTKFRVKRISSNMDGKGHRIELEVVGHEPKSLEEIEERLHKSVKKSNKDKFIWGADDLKLVKG